MWTATKILDEQTQPQSAEQQQIIRRINCHLNIGLFHKISAKFENQTSMVNDN